MNYSSGELLVPSLQGVQWLIRIVAWFLSIVVDALNALDVLVGSLVDLLQQDETRNEETGGDEWFYTGKGTGWASGIVFFVGALMALYWMKPVLDGLEARLRHRSFRSCARDQLSRHENSEYDLRISGDHISVEAVGAVHWKKTSKKAPEVAKADPMMMHSANANKVDDSSERKVSTQQSSSLKPGDCVQFRENHRRYGGRKGTVLKITPGRKITLRLDKHKGVVSKKTWNINEADLQKVN